MARSPASWLEMLEKRLHERWGRISIYDAYYEGDQRLALVTKKWNDTFGSFLGNITDNWCEIVVDSSAERLEVQGMRFGKEQDADDDAWDIWQANNLDGASNMVHTEAIKLEESYWLVQPPAARSDDPPRITAEHPSQVLVQHAAGDPTERLAAIKKWIDEDGFANANIYLPNSVVKYRSKAELNKLGMDSMGRIVWVQVETIPNPLGEVPIIPVRNSPSMLRGGRSDLKVALPIQNALNKELADMLIGSEYLAFPQRYLLGIDIPKNEDGTPIRSAELQAAQSRLWTFASNEIQAGEFSAADLTNYVKVRDNLLRNLTAKCRIPPHYVLGEIVNASGDALKAAEVGLVKKVKNKQPDMGEGHEQTMRLAFKALGDDAKAAEPNIETIWADAETRSQAEQVDAVTKQVTIGLPFEIALEKMGYSPTEIDRIMQIKETEALLNPPVLPTSGNLPPEAGPEAGAGQPAANGQVREPTPAAP